jgi:PAS domain S-box-containing protein
MKVLQRVPKYVQIVIVYLLFGGLWMFLVDYLIIRFTENPDLRLNLENYGGLLFVAVTAVLLYYERKHAVERQQRMERRFRIMADFIYDWGYWLGTDGSFSYISPSCERITGYTVEEFSSNPDLLEAIVHPEDKEMVRLHLSGEPAGSEPTQMEFRIITKSGEVRWISHACRYVEDREGKRQGTRASNRDITDHKLYEERERLHMEELAQADKMITLGTLVSGVAHEINNPTNVISLNTPLIREMWSGSQPVLDAYHRDKGEFFVGRFRYSLLRDRMDELLDGVSEGADRIKRIVNNLKDFARPDPSTMDERVDVNRVLADTAALLSNPIKKATAHFQVRYGKDLPEITGSPQKLEQVLVNLIQNALESLPDRDGGVHVSTRHDRRRGEVIVQIKDQGRGIPADQLARITDPFYTSRRREGGSGLGLSIAERIVKDHGGTLAFSSRVGKGTTVKVILKVPASG